MRARILAVVGALVLPTFAVPNALAGTASVSLAASDPLVVFGRSVIVSGAVAGAPGCVAGRTVDLQWRPAGSSAFETLATVTAGPEGGFGFEPSQPHTGRYRASLPASTTCEEATSPEVLVRVRTLVSGSVDTSSIEAGSCVDVLASVQPPKPGTVVELQIRADGAWQPFEELTLDAASQARARSCFGWDDIGVVRLRARWSSQDPLNESGTGPRLPVKVTQAGWMQEIGRVVGGRAVSISVGEDGGFLYRRADGVERIPASNEKLLLAMALLDTFGPEHRIATRAAVRSVRGGVVEGDLWILGRGDPRVGRSTLAALARGIADAGVTRVKGRVMGSTTYFRRDWNAPGWNSVARDYVNLPTALTFEGNRSAGPERSAASALTKQLRRLGVRIGGEPGAGAPPTGLEDVAAVASKPLDALVARMLRPSDNFAAEVLGKGLGARVRGAPGTIAKGAAAIRRWSADRGVSFTLYDSSGLSYGNRVTAEGIVRLLWESEEAEWGDELRRALPTGGQGTLRDRLSGVPVRAKTGSLSGVSALSGWIYSQPLEAWVEFSILCSGMSKATAVQIEDRVVRILRDNAG